MRLHCLTPVGPSPAVDHMTSHPKPPAPSPETSTAPKAPLQLDDDADDYNDVNCTHPNTPTRLQAVVPVPHPSRWPASSMSVRNSPSPLNWRDDDVTDDWERRHCLGPGDCPVSQYVDSLARQYRQRLVTEPDDVASGLREKDCGKKANASAAQPCKTTDTSTSGGRPGQPESALCSWW